MNILMRAKVRKFTLEIRNSFREQESITKLSTNRQRIPQNTNTAKRAIYT